MGGRAGFLIAYSNQKHISIILLVLNSQRSTYKYINTAPQWQCFNSGNWNFLENAVRSMVELQQFGPYAEIYTGTFGIMELPDINNNLQEIWLSGNQENQRVPVPKYFWKIMKIQRKCFKYL